MTNRDTLITYLEGFMASVPELQDVQVIPSTRARGELDRPVLIVKTDGYALNPPAPRAARVGRFTLTLVSPHRDLDRAEDQLDDLLEVFLPALLTWGLVWQTADYVGYDETTQAVDIRIESVLT